MKRVEKVKLNEKKIVERLKKGQLKDLMGGSGTFPGDCLLAGCGCQPGCQNLCNCA